MSIVARRVLAPVVLALAAFPPTLSAQQPPPRDSGIVAPRAPAAPIRDGAAAQAPAGAGVIAGRLVHRGDEATPVRRAMVALASANVTRRMVVTDDQGRFEFTGLPAGRYTLRFSKASYAATMYGAASVRAQGLTVALADGQHITDLVGTMMRGNVVTGRVTDERGQPVVGASVTVFERVTIGGRLTYRPTTAGSRNTDDRGVYRFYGFEPGEWTVAVRVLSAMAGMSMRAPTAEELRWAMERRSRPGGVGAAPVPAPPKARPVRHSSVYYPGVTNPATATFLTFGIGEERSGLDVVVPLVSTYSVSGQVTRPDGGPVVTTQVIAMPKTSANDNPLGIAVRPATARPDGTYTIDGLEPGEYTITARGASDPTPVRPAGIPANIPIQGTPVQDLWAMQDVFIGSDDQAGVNLGLQPAIKATGRVVFESSSGTPPPDPARVSLFMRPPPDGPVNFFSGGAQVSADGTFTLPTLMPGRYLMTANLQGLSPSNPAWVLKSATADGRDVLDEEIEINPATAPPPIEVTFTDRKTELTGTLLDQQGRPVPEFSVIAFGANPAHWRQGSRWLRAPVRPASDGRFTITGLPPGEYYFAALTRFDPQEWYTPSFLEQVVPSALKITLTEGRTTVQDVKLR
jgi:protocatechuate 3,4-dioxygenase beta subunit